MDRGGRFAGSLIARLDQAGADAFLHVHRVLRARQRKRVEAVEAANLDNDFAPPSVLAVILRRFKVRLANTRLRHGAGTLATCCLLISTVLLGIDRGGHWPQVRESFNSVRDSLAIQAGFKVNAVRISGTNRLTQAEIFAAAGITDATSVLFFDPVAAREGLKKQPWIAEATVQKLYPDQIQIAIVEREAYALWQRGRKIAVIDDGGTVIVDYLDERFRQLPLVVGDGAGAKAREILGSLDQFPAIRQDVAAAVLIAQTRWNLRLKNGTDVRLPEGSLTAALKRLAQLDADYKIMTRDIAAIDLRLNDRVTVSLSDDLQTAREAQWKERAKRLKKGSDA
jgi:cell division protein FtsQ